MQERGRMKDQPHSPKAWTISDFGRFDRRVREESGWMETSLITSQYSMEFKAWIV